jgi:thioredoxin-dependent peroxiredoxin
MVYSLGVIKNNNLFHMLKVGRKAPLFSLKDQNDTEQKLKSYMGQWNLIYFYPKDDTPGCTQEACVIAEVYKDFKRLKVNVFGVSKDTVKSHKKFAEKYNLPFILLSDPEMAIITKYGAFKEKHMFGKSVRGTFRMSYIVAPDGKIAKVYTDVDPANHALELIKDIKVLQKEAKKAAL